MRHVSRTKRANIGWLHEALQADDIVVEYTESNGMRADGLTKGFNAAPKWNAIRSSMNVGKESDCFRTSDQVNESPVENGDRQRRRGA